jgi:hypothetical protein
VPADVSLDSLQLMATFATGPLAGVLEHRRDLRASK